MNVRATGVAATDSAGGRPRALTPTGTGGGLFVILMALLALLVAFYPVPAPEVSAAGRYVLAVFALAIGLWVGTPQEQLTPASLIVLILVILALSTDPVRAAVRCDHRAPVDLHRPSLLEFLGRDVAMTVGPGYAQVQA